MKKELEVYQVDVFTDQKFAGNPAGVVANADGLSESLMLKIARELNNSETAFMLSPSDETHDYQVRFFTPTMEVPSCGHASIAGAHVWSKVRRWRQKRLMQKIQIGTLPMDVEETSRGSLIFMTQSQPEFGPEHKGELRSEIMRALGLDEEDLMDGLPIQNISTGHGKAIIPLKSVEKLNGLTPDFSRLAELTPEIGQNGYFLFALDGGDSDMLTHARMFAPGIGINEDPVTGNGNGPLGAYLVRHGVVEFGTSLTFKSRQGEAMGRPGTAHVRVDTADREIERVRVGGQCVVAFETRMVVEV